MAKTDGGQAFPRPMGWNGLPHAEEHQANDDEYGMSLRDYFAAKAMQAMLINNDYLRSVDAIAVRHGDMDHAPTLANAAYNYADAMIEERKK